MGEQFSFSLRVCRDRMVVGFITTIVVSSNPAQAMCILDTIQVCQRLATGRWFSPVSSTNKTDHHDITEILLKVNQLHLWQEFDHLLTFSSNAFIIFF
jgi:hypothetical protein